MKRKCDHVLYDIIDYFQMNYNDEKTHLKTTEIVKHIVKEIAMKIKI